MRRVLPMLLLLSCGDEFARQSQIRGVRVLAVKAEPAEIVLAPQGSPPPGPVTLSALAVAPQGEVAVTFALCRPGNAYDAAFECPGKDGLLLADNRLDLFSPEELAFLSPDSAAAFDPRDPKLLARLQAGIPITVGYEARAEDGSTERGVHRITLRLGETPNQNPVIEELLDEAGAPVQRLQTLSHTALVPRLGAGSVERFTSSRGEGTESVFFSWHATGDGVFASFRSQQPGEGDKTSRVQASSVYSAPAVPGEITIYLVARDGRGGTGWLARRISIVP